MKSIQIYSDLICPWCYIGKRRMEEALRQLQPGTQIARSWHPFQLNPGVPLSGIDRKVYRNRKFGSWERCSNHPQHFWKRFVAFRDTLTILKNSAVPAWPTVADRVAARCRHEPRKKQTSPVLWRYRRRSASLLAADRFLSLVPHLHVSPLWMGESSSDLTSKETK